MSMSDDLRHPGCPSGRIEGYQRINLDDGRIVQVGWCPDCGEVIARYYVITGPDTGPWLILAPAAYGSPER